jgi:ketosteroid isomerase-like protein
MTADAGESSDAKLVRETYEAFNRGDYEGSTAMLHDDVELHQAAAIPDTDTYVGKEEFVRGLTRWLSGFEPGFQYVPEELIDSGGRVFIRVLLRGCGRGSGVELEQAIFHVWEVRDGKPFRCWVFWDEEEARQAAGLSG